jgi:DNA polymerase-3 subunit delta
MPNVQMSTVNKLLQAAHQVDGVVKGLKHAEWPSEPWQALHRLAQMVVRVAN